MSHRKICNSKMSIAIPEACLCSPFHVSDDNPQAFLDVPLQHE